MAGLDERTAICWPPAETYTASAEGVHVRVLGGGIDRIQSRRHALTLDHAAHVGAQRAPVARIRGRWLERCRAGAQKSARDGNWRTGVPGAICAESASEPRDRVALPAWILL